MPNVRQDELATVFAAARKAGAKTVLDVALPGPGEYLSRLERLLPHVDIFLPNEHEAEDMAYGLSVARQIARALGGSPVRVAGEKKILYHAAAALASGHVLALVEAATQLLVSLGMNRSEAVRALLPLTRQVLDNFQRVGPRAAWTGPLDRGDYKIVEAHLRALRDSQEETAQAYEALNRLAARVLAQDPAGTTAELEKIFAALKPKAKVRGGYG